MRSRFVVDLPAYYGRNGFNSTARRNVYITCVGMARPFNTSDDTYWIKCRAMFFSSEFARIPGENRAHRLALRACAYVASGYWARRFGRNYPVVSTFFGYTALLASSARRSCLVVKRYGWTDRGGVFHPPPGQAPAPAPPSAPPAAPQAPSVVPPPPPPPPPPTPPL